MHAVSIHRKQKAICFEHFNKEGHPQRCHDNRWLFSVSTLWSSLNTFRLWFPLTALIVFYLKVCLFKKGRPNWYCLTQIKSSKPLSRFLYGERKAKLRPNIGHSYGKGVGFISANSALIVGLLKSITHPCGSILFTLQLPCYAVYCCVCSMRTCHCLALVGSRWKASQCVTVLLKRGSIIRSLHVKMFWSRFSGKSSLTLSLWNLSEMIGCFIYLPPSMPSSHSVCHAQYCHVLLG